MKIEQIFNINRFVKLYKQELSLNLKQILFTLGAAIAVIASIHTFSHIDEYPYLNKLVLYDYHLKMFLSLFVIGGILLNGISFSAFRAKAKTINYLITPASIFEKFLFEFVNRIVLYILFFPILYWLSTNLVTSIFHILNPEYTNFLFRFDILKPKDIEFKVLILILSIGLFLFTIPFTGATIFSNKPLLKTILFSFIIGLLYFFLIYSLVEGFKLYHYHIDKLFWVEKPKQVVLPAIILANLGHLALLSISYFKIKEKEV